MNCFTQALIYQTGNRKSEIEGGQTKTIISTNIKVKQNKQTPKVFKFVQFKLSQTQGLRPGLCLCSGSQNLEKSL